MAKQKRDRTLPSTKRFITVVSPATGTETLTFREVLKSSRGGKYIKYCGKFHKIDKSGIRIKFGHECRDTLP